MTSPATDDLLQAFDSALASQCLHMAYQPKASLSDGSIYGVEALMRWNDPKFGVVEPGTFVPLAESHGRIDDLTLWGLRTILRQWRSWADAGFDTRFAFNISAYSLQNLDFPDLVEWMCRGLEVPTGRLSLELTEGSTQPLIKLMDTLTRFRIKGIGLALDDFGTGYSSMFQLRHLPFTTLKVDRAFVCDLETSRDCRMIVKAMIGLAQDLGLEATAEGVETLGQLQILRELGCHRAQGYLIAPPMLADELVAWSRAAPDHMDNLFSSSRSGERRIEVNSLS